MQRFSLAAIAAVLILGPSRAEEIRVLTWIVESGGNDPGVISQQLTELQANHGPYGLIGLTEVRASNAAAYEQAVGAVPKQSEITVPVAIANVVSVG